MLLVHPVDTAVKLLPVLAVSLIVGTRSGNPLWALAAVVGLVAIGAARWYTTSYRIGPVHVQLRRGLLQRRLLSIPRSRIRSVDVESGILHRVLGLSIVRIGTGQQAAGSTDSNRFELDALSSSVVPALRSALLADALGAAPAAAAGTVPTQPAPEIEIAHWRPSWVRYAPFSATGVLAIAALVGVLFQYGLGEQLVDSERVRGSVESAERAGIALLLAGAVVALLVVASLVACVRYLVTFGNLRVTDNGRTLHVSHGLSKTRQTTLDRARLRGATLKEPLLLRMAGGARLDAIMTGVSAEKGESSLLLPQSPRAEAERVMSTVVGDPRLSQIPLLAHGPAARRRRYTRALLLPVLILVAVAVVGVAIRPLPVIAWAGAILLVVAAVGLAYDRYRGLGHAAPPGWLITRGGSLDRARHTLAADGIIGWTVRQTYFQRRAGVATVVAATPAGTGGYEVVDMPADLAWTLVEAVTPGAGDRWADRGPA
ncbi:PH domain-containing protein [Rhodococcus triatomae]|nr:PH domain-containing protein [Rhodococcus triatomae]QNG21195.1 PH domain-containing protein [Rhodococcus triatomae]QNG25515.1 PH domain-containing protein [Rhodococcus triatomae]